MCKRRPCQRFTVHCYYIFACRPQPRPICCFDGVSELRKEHLDNIAGGRVVASAMAVGIAEGMTGALLLTRQHADAAGVWRGALAAEHHPWPAL
jgi:hypothetical protein